MASKLLDLICQEEAEYVDIRFTDPRGKLQHVTVVADLVDADFVEEGFMFDGSSIAGWKSIDQSDMKLLPDAESAYVDPFFAEKTICVHCNVVEPDTGEPYSRDPRGTGREGRAYLKASGIGDQAFFGPEAEFFIFDNVRFACRCRRCRSRWTAWTRPGTRTRSSRPGNTGHRPGIKGGYFPVPPIDDAQDLRSRCCPP
jgi:glutamine synthetase